MSDTKVKMQRAQSWDGEGLSSLSQSLQEILSPSPPPSGRKGRLMRSASTREVSISDSPSSLTPIDEKRSSPIMSTPRLKRNVTYSHMPTDLFADEEDGAAAEDAPRGGEAHRRLRAECGSRAKPPASPEVGRSPLLKRRSSSSAVRSAFPKTVFDHHDMVEDPFAAVGDLEGASAAPGGPVPPPQPFNAGWAPGAAGATPEQMQQQWQQLQAQYMQQWMYWMQMQQTVAMQQMQQSSAAAAGPGMSPMMMPPPPPAMMMGPGMHPSMGPAAPGAAVPLMAPPGYPQQPPAQAMGQGGRVRMGPGRRGGYGERHLDYADEYHQAGTERRQQQHHYQPPPPQRQAPAGGGRGRAGRGGYNNRGGGGRGGRGEAQRHHHLHYGGGNGASRCALLEEHKVTRRWPTMEELSGHVAEFSVDAQGSRYVQHRMEAAQQEEKQLLIDEILSEVSTLADDGYGNYVVQNFFDHGSQAQRSALAAALSGALQGLSKRPHGCRVVQRLLELVEPCARRDVIDELLELPNPASLREKRKTSSSGEGEAVGGGESEERKSGQRATSLLVQFSQHPSATHVLQKVALVLQTAIRGEGEEGGAESLREPEDEADGEARRQLNAMEEAFARLGDEEMLGLSCHPHAYRVVQKLLGDCDGRRSAASKRIVDLIEGALPRLAFDQHGNFLLQHMLDSGSAKQAALVQGFVVANAHDLCCHKFASHLVEKCLTTESANETQKSALVRALLAATPSSDNEEEAEESATSGDPLSDPLLRLMQDPYANFVVQRAFDETRGMLVHDELCGEIKARSAELSHFTFGRHILQHVTAVPGAAARPMADHQVRGRPRRNRNRNGGRNVSPANNGNGRVRPYYAE